MSLLLLLMSALQQPRLPSYKPVGRGGILGSLAGTRPPLPKLGTSPTLGSAQNSVVLASSARYRVPAGSLAAPLPPPPPSEQSIIRAQNLEHREEMARRRLEDRQMGGDEFMHNHDEDSRFENAQDDGAPVYPQKIAPIQAIAKTILMQSDREIESRIIRVDGDVLLQPQFATHLAEIMDHAKRLVRQIGVGNVIELIIHAHTKVVYNRWGHRVLDGYVLRCKGETHADVLDELDFGHHCMILPIHTESVKSIEDAKLRSMTDALTNSVGGDSASSSKSRCLIHDEGLMDQHGKFTVQTASVPSASKKKTFSASKARTGYEKVPILAYNGEIAFMQSFTHGVGPTYQMLVQNHSTSAASILRERVRDQHLTVNELYRSLAYDTCMTHGARSCLKIARAAAQAMGLDLELVDSVQSSGSLRDLPDSAIQVDVCAPLTFIVPVPEFHADGYMLKPTFLVYVNTYGEHDLSRISTPTSAKMNRETTLQSERMLESKSVFGEGVGKVDCRGFPLFNSCTGECVAMRQINPSPSLMERYWLHAQSKDFVQASKEMHDELRPIPSSMLEIPCFDTTGYPTRGIFDAAMELHDATDLEKPLVSGGKRTRPCHVIHRAYLQPHQSSRHYIPIVPTPRIGPMFTLWSRAFPQNYDAPRQYVVLYSSDVLLKYCGGLHGACVTSDMVLTLRSKEDYLRIPTTNIELYNEIMSMALHFAKHCAEVQRDVEDKVRTEISPNSWLVRDGSGRQAYLDKLAGGALQCDPLDQVTLLVDRTWFEHCRNTYA